MGVVMAQSMPTGNPAIIDWSVGARTLAHQAESGDLHVVAPFDDGALVAVIDGLGHGHEAAVASRAAETVLRLYPQEQIPDLMRRCHAELRKTRGVVLSLASFDAARNVVTWLGVGNVEGILFRGNAQMKPSRESLLLRGGVVGYQLPPLRPVTLPIFHSDTLIMVTDGINRQFSGELPIGREPQEVADAIIYRFARATDDALVLVARYLGGRQ